LFQAQIKTDKVDARILADLLREPLQESSAVKYVRNLPGMGPILPALVTEIDGQRLVFREPGSVLYGCVSTSPAHATS
jgi:hypothetical protein